MAADTHAELTEADGILTATLTREDKLNAISPQITETLWEAANRLAERDDLRALVITGRGRFFSAGIDLKAPMPATLASTGSHFRRLYREHHRLYDELEAIEKPIVLAAQGPCLGAGLEMAVSCDFRFASDTTYFQLPEVGLGTIAGSGGTSRLTRLVGPHWAKWIAMANRKVDAERALMIGLVHEVFPVDGFHERVHQLVREIVALPREALGAAKLAIDMVEDVDRDTARHIERVLNTSLVYSDEFREQMAQFAARSKR
jgi:enoyl-CoA hydratase/carnithine racemase